MGEGRCPWCLRAGIRPRICIQNSDPFKGYVEDGPCNDPVWLLGWVWYQLTSPWHSCRSACNNVRYIKGTVSREYTSALEARKKVV
jgi:hypothetical protein